MSYSSVEVNKHLTRIFKGDELVGYARMGLDKLWYPELLGVRSRGAAIHTVMIAHEALEEADRAING
jgi:hypothetical protein